eukprot:TRINITY_DN52049_c0_g1_i1.p1 TRINITY_DN52049_c0_g1~~TRINITY_DN52049_c0_g1_i1.p1  ORF type:complete len:481 (+),score=56.96 TRINITY_DN52049_c0_g1_i1:182-1444(+)
MPLCGVTGACACATDAGNPAGEAEDADRDNSGLRGADVAAAASTVDCNACEGLRRVTTLKCGDAQCHVVGVCHLSRESIEDARQAVQRLKPSLVCIELCHERVNLLTTPSSDSLQVLPQLNFQTFRERWRSLVDPIFWILDLQMMALEALLDSRLGAEQSSAYEAAQEVDAGVLLVDRPMSITFNRTLAALADWVALKELFRAMRAGVNDGNLPGVLGDVAQLELLLLRSEHLSVDDFKCAVRLARKVVDAVLNEPQSGHVEKAFRPIHEERDFLLSHSLFHAGCAAGQDRSVVAVFGAAHVTGVAAHFESFRQRGCSLSSCGCEEEVGRLNEASRAPLYWLLGSLCALSVAGIGGRVALSRYLRRTRGPLVARRVNIGLAAVGVGFGAFGVYRARRQYEGVRALQLHRQHFLSTMEDVA